jgi:hypothetical protein
MEIRGKRIMVLGGWGLVGMAICRQLLNEQPEEIIVSSLTEDEANSACERLLQEAKRPQKSDRPVKLTPAHGNIFLSTDQQGHNRQEILENDDLRWQLMQDVLGELDNDLLERSFLYRLIQKHKPQIIVDCINSATAVAYQDVYATYYRLRPQLEEIRRTQQPKTELAAEVEKLLCTLYVPQLIRHVQIFYESMRRAETKYYFKIGTSGTGGMGLNIPYTHSEEKPSRVLLSKSSVAGAHTMLLFLMARTPDAPIIKEIKPTAAIAWKRIEYGPIVKAGRAIKLFDCPPEAAITLQGNLALKEKRPFWEMDGQVLKSVFIDTGENGIFSMGEFSAISSFGQMEFITPEEIASNVIYEIKGGNTGHDIINALDNAVMGPTYRAGIMRHDALKRMQELAQQHDCESVAFELLGPPRLSKLLWEAQLLNLTCGTLAAVRDGKPAEIAAQMETLVLVDKTVRSHIISIGIPILLRDGQRLLRGPEIKIPPYRGRNQVPVNETNLEHWAHDGWVDLRVKNVEQWQHRIKGIFEEIQSIPEDDTSSRFDRNRRYWQEDEDINVGKVVGWIFSNEEHGSRMKA